VPPAIVFVPTDEVPQKGFRFLPLYSEPTSSFMSTAAGNEKAEVRDTIISESLVCPLNPLNSLSLSVPTS
jgi:hypothetical protein